MKNFMFSIIAGITASATAVVAADTIRETPAAVATVSAEDIERTETSSVADLLKRVAVLEDRAEKSGWPQNVSIRGDLRYRYEHKEDDGDVTTDRHRFRARVGAYASLADNVKTGIRLASGSDNSPTSTNETLDGNFSKKQVWIDLAYITIAYPEDSSLSATFGKMKQPWVQVSDLIFDTDVNPEGISAAHTFGEDLPVTTIVGYHLLDEDKGDDVELVSGQISTAFKVEEDIKLSLGTGAFIFNNIERIEPIGYDIINGFAKLDIKKGPAPFKVFAEYLNNIDSGDSEDTAWIAGISTKVKGISLAYNYRDVDANAVWDALDEGDFGGPDGKGHKINVKYGMFRNTSIGATYYRTEHGGVDEDVLQLDLVAKF